MEILIVGYGNIGKHMYEEFKSLQSDIYDPNLSEYSMKQNKRYGFAFICVPTDSLPDGSCDTSIVERAVAETEADIIVIKSTVPPGTTNLLIASTGKKIVFSPENYGVTQHCKTDPGFVTLGGDKKLCGAVAQIYARVKNGNYKINFTDTVTAELSKYMLNSFLALKVTFCSEFADIAKKYGVSYPELREIFVSDERAGNSHTFVYPDKPYYDSHCFNKDVPAIVQFAGDTAPLISHMDIINKSKKRQKRRFMKSDFQKIYVDRMLIGNPPDNRLNEAMRLESTKLLRLKREALKRSLLTKFKYYCSVCLIIRDENEYLEEWLDWHIKLGVQHFYIYDHGSKEPVAGFIKTLSPDIADKVTVTDWSGYHKDAQPDAYNDCMNRYKGISKWIGFIDTDEHVNIKTGQTLPEFLKGYEEFAGLFAVWLTYGANGHKNKSNVPLRQRFTRASLQHEWTNKAGKIFVQPIFMRDVFIHNGSPVKGFEIVGEWKDTVDNYRITKRNPSSDLICIEHFYTKSYEEWLEKLRRGTCHVDFTRRYDEFFTYNPDMENCREDINIVQEYENFK